MYIEQRIHIEVRILHHRCKQLLTKISDKGFTRKEQVFSGNWKELNFRIGCESDKKLHLSVWKATLNPFQQQDNQKQDLGHNSDAHSAVIISEVRKWISLVVILVIYLLGHPFAHRHTNNKNRFFLRIFIPTYNPLRFWQKMQ